ncbi:hypothetical protein J3R30DRAFT_3511041 [Lentinula aciculospora]|uniref:F-box domain-containing protein n=1 Tax=Lentinula aciculospora TaxID=153920 RepID=A0A9W9DJM1_9AGAR|nr:hypothetical protein J3R30DRAFT_3511041 [Lentinula aciculospora]
MPAVAVDLIPNQLEHLANMLRKLMAMDSVPRLQLSNASERETIVKAIDSGIGILANLKSYRNALTSISFLPDEILSEIFYKVMIAEDVWSTDWCRLIFVCRRWNRIVTDHGRFWSWISERYILEDKPSPMKVLEKRSKGYPLSFRLSTSRFTSMVIQNSHRVRFLELDGKRSDFDNFFDDVTDFPLLENFRFCRRKWDEESAISVHVPSSFIERAPCLRWLCLEDVAFEKGENLQLLGNLTNLTHLNLARGVGSHEILPALPSLQDIYSTIRSLPALQTLKIRHYVGVHTSGMQHLSPISLPALRLLDLNMDIQIITSILQFLTFSPTTRTSYIAHTRLDEHSSYSHDIKFLLVHIRRHLRHKDTPILRSATIECGMYLIFSVSHEDRCPSPFFSRNEPPINYLLVYPSTQRETRQMIAKIINAFPLENVVTLDAMAVTHGNHRPDVKFNHQHFSWETWRTLVRLLPIGITIRIGVNDGMLALLRGVIDAMARSPDALPSGRRLKRLHRQQGFGSLPLSNLVLSASCNVSYLRHGVDTGDQDRLYNGLLDHLTTYRGLNTKLKPEGQPLKTLAFEDLRLSYCHRFAKQLFEVTGSLSYENVVWNPVEIRQQTRKLRKRMRRLRRNHPDLALPQSDSDQSPLSSDSERN